MSPRDPEGSAHGRFQPLHNGHLEYLLAAKAQCERLWIGITQPDIRTLRQTQDVHRGTPDNNPLTFFERHTILHEALLEAGVKETEFSIVPFPIEEPGVLLDYLAPSIPIYTTIYDDWNRHKVKVLGELGYDVRILWERSEKEHVGAVIRESILAGAASWERAVPAATRRAVKRLDLGARLASLRSSR